MIINHNMNAMNAHRLMTGNTAQAGKSMEKLSSGLRINRAGDDAAGLAISEKMRAQIRGLDQAQRNSQDGISMIQTAEGALNETHSILQRMRELGTQAANDTNVTVDRQEIQKEINQLTSEINRIGNTTEFNTQKVLEGGDATGEVTLTTTTAGAAGTAGVASLKIDTNFAVGDVLEINGTSYTAGSATSATAHTFKVGADASATAKELATAIGSEAGTPTGDTITLTQGTPSVAANPFAATARGDFKATLQIGANEGQAFQIEIKDMRAAALKVSGGTAGSTIGASDGKTTAKYATSQEVTNGTNNTGAEYALDVSSHDNASAAIKVINDAIENVSAERSRLGAYQNRLEHTINNLGTASENLTASESRIRDVDMAKEMMTFSKKNILSQAAQAMLAQANQQPQGVLQLLR